MNDESKEPVSTEPQVAAVPVVKSKWRKRASLAVGALIAVAAVAAVMGRDEHVAVLDQRRHLPIEEREQQRADVRTVDIRVGHDDDAVVAQFAEIEFFGPDTATQRGD